MAEESPPPYDAPVLSERLPGVQSASAPAEYKHYPGRYYVLAVTAMLSATQNVAWLTFGPIPDQAREKYGLTDAELTILPRKFSSLVGQSKTIEGVWRLLQY